MNIFKKIRSWFPLSNVPSGYFGGYPSEYQILSPRQRALHGPETALTLSPFWAALRLYQNSLSVLPLVAYRRDANGGRTRLQDPQIYRLLHDRPNPAQSRAVFFDFLVKDYWLHGNCYAHIQWSGNHRPLALYPIPAHCVTKIELDDQWRKVYTVQTGEGEEVYHDEEMIHVMHYSHCGIKGTSFIRFAGESLGLHKQVLDTATSYYANSVKPSFALKYAGRLTKEALENVKTGFKDEYSGPQGTGRIPIIQDNGEIVQFPQTAANDAQMVEALGIGVGDIGRWFDNLSPLVIGDLSRGTYSNSAADKLAFHQKNMLPLLEKFQLEINYKLFGNDDEVYAEFLTDNILRADPLTQSEVWGNGIRDGYLLRSEVREWLNLPAVEGIDQQQAQVKEEGNETADDPLPATD